MRIIIKTISTFNPTDYEFNGSLTAIVNINGAPAAAKNDLLFAYVNNEIRGVVESQYFDPIGAYLFPIMVHSNLREGEIIEFRYYNSGNDKFFACNETITFREDMIVSDAFKPLVLNVIKSVVTNVTKDIPIGLKFITYPNPFNHFLNIEYTIPNQTNVRLTVYDLYGRIIQILVNEKQEPDKYSIQWDSSNQSVGMYIIKLQIGDEQIIKKVILTRKNI